MKVKPTYFHKIILIRSFYKINFTLVYMTQKCELCDCEIKTTFLDKLDGTIIKTGEGETSKKHFICSACQKEHKDSIKEKLG